jgi:hypothetical protein
MGLSPVRSFPPKQVRREHACYNIHLRDTCEAMDEIIGGVLVLIDVGDHQHCLTVTNDIESIVETLAQQGVLLPHMKLSYYDSEGILTEVFHENGKFVRFGGWSRT